MMSFALIKLIICVNDLITFRNIINEENHNTVLLTALLEHGKFRAEHNMLIIILIDLI